jgi:hypothetical protein
MARIDIKSNGTGGGGGGGNLQLASGASMDATLRSVTDTSNTASPLKLSTASVQVNSPLRITTSDASGFYLDAEDSATNNRFSIKRDPSSQEVTLDFASNPAGSTTLVGAIRTYQDGVNLSNAMSFIEDGSVGIGTNTPVGILHIKKTAANTRLVIDGDAGFNRLISYRTGAVQRFGLYVNNTAESGSNVGSDFAIRAYSDAGTLLNTPVFIKRSTGNVGINTLTGTAKLQVVGSGSTSATTSLLVQNSAGNTSLQVTDEQQLTGFSAASLRFRLGFTSAGQSISTRDGEFSVGLVDVLGASLRFLTLPTGSSYIDGYTEGATKGANYPLFIGSRANNNGNNTTGSTTQENGTQTIFGSAVSDASALVQINSTTRGFLPPRMTNAQRLAIGTPAVGLMVYCTDAVEGLYVYKSTGWTFVI